MKRVLLNEISLLEEKLIGYGAMLNYRYLNLCVKAEEASLLPVVIMIEGSAKKIEDVAIVAKKNDYQFMVIPKMEEDLLDTAKGITMAHPEFKQIMETMTVDTVDENAQPTQKDVKYILLTMPEVDDDRYDVLKQSVDALYQTCKLRMDAANGKADPRIANYLLNEKPDEADKVRKNLDKMRDDKKQRIDKMREEKLKEIEEGHDKWLALQAERDQQHEEEDAARGADKLGSMKMSSDTPE